MFTLNFILPRAKIYLHTDDYNSLLAHYSTLFLTECSNPVFCATYVSSRISISVIRSVGRDVAFPGGSAVAKQGGLGDHGETYLYAHASAFDFHVLKCVLFLRGRKLCENSLKFTGNYGIIVSANMHQGNDLFSVYSRGRQCAFICLSAPLTVRNNPVFVWSKTTLNNVLLQGDSMYLEALDNGLMVLDPGVDLLSINNLPSVIYVTCNTNINDNFSYSVCQPAMDTSIDLIGDEKPAEPQTITDPPIVVEPIEAQTIIDPPIVVEPIEAQTIISSLPDGEGNESQIWLINYGREFQGRVISDQEIESRYYNIYTALVNTFLNDSYAILILEGYMMALIKQTEYFYLFDSHARDLHGMPDPNGMKFKNILDLEQYLYFVSMELHTNLFEIVPLQLNKHTASKTTARCITDKEYQKKRRSLETEGTKIGRLQKAVDLKKRRQSEETDSKKQSRLKKIESLKKESSLNKLKVRNN